MKKTATIMACAVAMVAAAYTKISGSWDTWHGALSGQKAIGDRNTLVGAGAGAISADAEGSFSVTRSTLVGAASGAMATNMVDCIGIGYRALYGATDVENCVAIGKNAGAGWNDGMDGSTYINGAFMSTPYMIALCYPGQNASDYLNAAVYIDRTQNAAIVNGDACATGALILGWGGEAEFPPHDHTTLTPQRLATLITNTYNKVEVYALITNLIQRAMDGESY